MPLLYGYRLGQYGKIEHRLFDGAENIPAGWYDSPTKVPNVPPPVPKPEPVAAPAPANEPPYGAVYGERKRGGWPKGVSRAAMAKR